MRAYYFSTEDRKLRYGDGSKTEKPIELCECWVSAYIRPIEALRHARGSILHVIELGGEIIEGDDDIFAEHIICLAEFDAEELLREFARKQALINIEKIKPYCSESDYDAVIKYLLTGEGRSEAEQVARSAWSAVLSTAPSLRSADMAAWSAARSAAWSAAESEAWSAESAANSAADSAADSARSAARSASWLASRSEDIASNEMLEDMINSALKDNK
jgi:hypothetical protein